MLSVLRQPGDGGHDLAPAPGLADLQRLYDQARDSGVSVRETFEGHPAPLSPAAELALYRMVQEALTNVIKHAPGSAVEVKLAYGPASIEVEVKNGPSPVMAVAPATGAGIGGQGLAGMRERLSTVGGTLLAEARAEGGFSVKASIPLEPLQ
jgi:signal transduction histidine kinase